MPGSLWNSSIKRETGSAADPNPEIKTSSRQSSATNVQLYHFLYGTYEFFDRPDVVSFT
jgi:hypothetical protein